MNTSFRLMIALVSALAVAPLAAEEPRALFSSKPIWTSGTRSSGGDGNARWIDADKDGDLDLVTSLPNPRRWVLFENQGGRLSKKPCWESRSTTDCDHISVLDFNGDGWKDLAGTHESHCTLYFNGMKSKAPQSFQKAPDWETGIVTDANQIHFGDFDLDGDQDMLMASGLPLYGLAIFENEGGKLSQFVSQRVGPREYSETAIFADIDSDDDLDIVAAYGKKGTVYVYSNEGGKFDQGSLIYRDPANAWCQRLYCVDLDKDGDKELFLAKGPWGPPGPSVALSRKDSGEGWEAVWRSGARTGFHGFDFRDVDNDGDLDVAAADWGGRRVALFLQKNGKLAKTPAWTAKTTGPAHEVHFGDADGDGDLDLAAGCLDQAMVFENLMKRAKD